MIAPFATNANTNYSVVGAHARFCIGLLLVALVSGCTVQVACNLYNNSGSDLTIIRSRSGEQEKRILIKAGSSTLLHDWSYWSYRVELKDKMLRYIPQIPENDFVVTQGFGPWVSRIFKTQIERDGRIYVLRPGQVFPTKDFVEQPAGFPLVPAAVK